jgi:hypothetical protein
MRHLSDFFILIYQLRDIAIEIDYVFVRDDEMT